MCEHIWTYLCLTQPEINCSLSASVGFLWFSGFCLCYSAAPPVTLSFPLISGYCLLRFLQESSWEKKREIIANLSYKLAWLIKITLFILSISFRWEWQFVTLWAHWRSKLESKCFSLLFVFSSWQKNVAF